jgi:hypothetical protein
MRGIELVDLSIADGLQAPFALIYEQSFSQALQII